MKKFLFTFALILVTPCLAFAQQKYQPLINIPGVTDAGDGTFAGYINFLYAFSIGIAGLLAVIKIIVAGVKYMMTDVVSTKSNAKGEITGALLGLLLILGAYIILNTINPRLNKQETNFDALPPDPELANRPSVTTEDGKTPDQVTNALAQNLPTCSVTSSLGISANGLYTLNQIDVSKCNAADTKTALAEFAKNCTQSGGSQNGTNIYQCRTVIVGAQQGKDFASSIAGMAMINTTAQLGANYVKQVGTLITTDVNAACDNNVKDFPADQKKGQYSVCVTHTKGVIESHCDDSYGKYNGSNTSAVTCQLPKSVKDISSLADAFAKYKSADPGRKYDTFSNLTVAQEREVCEKYAGGIYFDITGTNNKCVFY